MKRSLHAFLFAITLALALCAGSYGQTPTPQQDDDVVRVNTELVQTDVMVFDKKGRFVDQLKPEQFQLVVDNQPQQIAFFERVANRAKAGSDSATSNGP